MARKPKLVLISALIPISLKRKVDAERNRTGNKTLPTINSIVTESLEKRYEDKKKCTSN